MKLPTLIPVGDVNVASSLAGTILLSLRHLLGPNIGQRYVSSISGIRWITTDWPGVNEFGEVLLIEYQWQSSVFILGCNSFQMERCLAMAAPVFEILITLVQGGISIDLTIWRCNEPLGHISRESQ